VPTDDSTLLQTSTETNVAHFARLYLRIYFLHGIISDINHRWLSTHFGEYYALGNNDQKSMAMAVMLGNNFKFRSSQMVKSKSLNDKVGSR